jgi:NAD-dependent deacetylase
MVPPRLSLDENTYVLVLTGAGISAESGIPTFRGSNGLWETHPVEEVASPGGFVRDPALVWRFYSQRREKAATCVPNAGHRALVSLEKQLGNRFLLATQNVDGLHRKAGSERLVEMHGNLFTSRCARCSREPFADERVYAEPPRCSECDDGLLRPHIVWFGEMLDPDDLSRIDAFIETAVRKPHRLVFVAVGTSGAVYPAAGLVDVARRAGGETYLVNADEAENTGRFQHFLQGQSGALLPKLVGLPD